MAHKAILRVAAPEIAEDDLIKHERLIPFVDISSKLINKASVSWLTGAVIFRLISEVDDEGREACNLM